MTDKETVRDKFIRLSTQWKAETAFFSFIQQAVINPVAKEIINMGYDAIPFIIQELRCEPNHFWFGILREITGENPASIENAQKMPEMINAWTRWWDEENKIRCAENTRQAIISQAYRYDFGDHDSAFSIEEDERDMLLDRLENEQIQETIKTVLDTFKNVIGGRYDFTACTFCARNGMQKESEICSKECPAEPKEIER